MNHQHDKIFRTVLDRKSDALALINKALNTQLEVQDIEKYNSSFINKVFQNREADIVYKIKDRSIFILIEHQTKVDYLMPYRILEYEVAIMQSAIDLDKIKNKESKIPLVIPIVLYTGNKKWNAKKYLEENQEKIEGIENGLGNYNLIDINELTEKELLEDNSFISKMMLIEKSKNTENIVEILEKIVKITKEEDKDTLRRIISIILEEKIGITKAKELIEKMEGDEGNMLAVVDMIRRENQMYIEIGKKEGELKEKIKIVTNMLKEKFNIETIQKITGINKEEIEKISQNNNDN
ncbi:MAG: Rpn family recombination-promoting nuclease/putative transposase [Clostridia bacterium]